MSRSLKIREIGDFYRNKTKPVILLSGKWLEQAGFSPNNRVNIQIPEPGKMIIIAQENFPQEQ